MNADAIKTLTTDALDKLAALLDKGQSKRLTALLKTMARFHKYSWHNVFLLCRSRHNRHHADSRIMPRATRRFVVVEPSEPAVFVSAA
jgi:hypothetical protein